MWVERRGGEGEMKEGKSLEITMKQEEDDGKVKDKWGRKNYQNSRGKCNLVEFIFMVQKKSALWMGEHGYKRKVLSGWQKAMVLVATPMHRAKLHRFSAWAGPVKVGTHF